MWLFSEKWFRNNTYLTFLRKEAFIYLKNEHTYCNLILKHFVSLGHSVKAWNISIALKQQILTHSQIFFSTIRWRFLNFHSIKKKFYNLIMSDCMFNKLTLFQYYFFLFLKWDHYHANLLYDISIFPWDEGNYLRSS